MKKLFLAVVFLCSTPAALAAEIADVHFEESISLSSVEQPLQLNGLGIRYKFFFKIYIAALYVQNPSSDPGRLLASNEARRMTMHFLYDEVERQKLVDGWNEGFENNLDAEQLNALKPRIDRFNALFETMKRGEQIHLDYVPGQGTAVVIRGQLKGQVPGEDFNRALMKIWLGDYPVGDDLKQALLGKD